MISAHPEWVEKILKGEKTIEVRPWIPKGELPLKVLIYVTKGEQLERHWTKILPLSEQFILYGQKVEKDRLSSPHCLNGRVVASFILNKVEEIIGFGDEKTKKRSIEILKMACLTPYQAQIYLVKDCSDTSTRIVGYAWHIDDLEIFDKPKELSEFYHYKKKLIDCGMDCPSYYDEVKVQLTKAPQKMVWVVE